jgi:hypothetical protein
MTPGFVQKSASPLQDVSLSHCRPFELFLHKLEAIMEEKELHGFQ